MSARETLLRHAADECLTLSISETSRAQAVGRTSAATLEALLQMVGPENDVDGVFRVLPAGTTHA